MSLEKLENKIKAHDRLLNQIKFKMYRVAEFKIF